MSDNFSLFLANLGAFENVNFMDLDQISEF